MLRPSGRVFIGIKGRAFIDETFYTGNIDMNLTGDLKDIINLRKQLINYGLDIIEVERELDIFVISDLK